MMSTSRVHIVGQTSADGNASDVKVRLRVVIAWPIGFARHAIQRRGIQMTIDEVLMDESIVASVGLRKCTSITTRFPQILSVAHVLAMCVRRFSFKMTVMT
jgi:hypothetical protein